MGRITIKQETITPSTPSTANRALYPKADGWYEMNDQGVERSLFSNDNVYGQEYFSAVKDTQDTISGTLNYKTYLTLNYNDIQDSDTAKYVLKINVLWNHSSTGTDYRARTRLNGSIFGPGMKVEPKDTGSDQRIPYNMEIPLTGSELGASGSISYEYGSSGGNTARTYYCFMQLVRVA